MENREKEIEVKILTKKKKSRFPPKTKVFNGKTYKFVQTYGSMRLPQSFARKMREFGRQTVRMVKWKDQIAVYMRNR